MIAKDGTGDGVMCVDSDMPLHPVTTDAWSTLSPGFTRYDDSVFDKSATSVYGLFTFDVCFDDLMLKAYGASLVPTVDENVDSVWYSRWTQVV